MATTYNSIAYRVTTDDAQLPGPTPGDGGILSYTASITLGSAADVASIAALLSIVTVKPALGMVNGGTIVVEAGPGSKTLVLPTSAGSERTFAAILTDFQSAPYVTTDATWRCDATWMLLAETL